MCVREYVYLDLINCGLFTAQQSSRAPTLFGFPDSKALSTHPIKASGAPFQYVGPLSHFRYLYFHFHGFFVGGGYRERVGHLRQEGT